MPQNFRIIVFFLLFLAANSGPSFHSTPFVQVIEADNSPILEPASDIDTSVSGAEVRITRTSEAFEGYNLFVLLKTNRVTQQRNLSMLIVDMNGEVFLEENLGVDLWVGDCPAELLDPTTVLVGSDFSAAIYNITDGSMDLLPLGGYHEYEYNPLDDTFFTFHFNEIDVDEVTYLYDAVVEFDRQGTVVWSFDTTSLMSVGQWCPYQDYLEGLPDVTHMNTIFFDAEEDSIYLMSRNANTFWKINHSSGEVVWGLGELGNFTLFDQWGNPRNNLFFHAHAVERVDDDTFILFDNDYHNQTDEFNQISRIVEITIDEDTMTANTSWVWNSEEDYYSFLWGDADRLPNGNRLGVFGISGFDVSQYGARIVEVSEEHEIEWEMAFVNDETNWYGIYRDERVLFQPILEVLEEENGFPEGDITLNFGAWFNYRPKRDIEGSFNLHIDDILVEEGTVIFDRFWRPAIISHTVRNPASGLHNATLIVWDGSGHSASIMAQFSVANVIDNSLLLFTISIMGLVGLVILWKYAFHGKNQA
jgi:hypothetical protein